MRTLLTALIFTGVVFVLGALVPRVSPVLAQCVNCCVCGCDDMCWGPRNCSDHPVYCSGTTHCGDPTLCNDGDCTSSYVGGTCTVYQTCIGKRRDCYRHTNTCNDGTSAGLCPPHDPCIGYCGDTGGPTNTPGPTSPPPPTPTPDTGRTCTVTASAANVTAGTPVTFTVTGQGDSGVTQSVDLFVHTWQGGETISPPPGTQIGPYDGTYYYNLGSCSSVNNAQCGTSATVTLPAGTYYAHCGVDSVCSGNPQCIYELLGGTKSCTGWMSCSSTDNAQVTVTAPPMWCEVSGTLASGFTVSGNASRGGNTGIRVRLQSWDPSGTRINSGTVPYTVNTNQYNATELSVAQPSTRYYYTLDNAACTSSNYANCSRNFNFPNASIPPGTYYLHCYVEDSVPYCTGNPWCSANGPGSYNCGASYPSCSTADNVSFFIPSPTPTPTAAARARARTLSDVPSACANITGNTNWRDTTFTMTGESNRSSVGSTYATWSPLASTGSKVLGIPTVTDYTPYWCRTGSAFLNPALTYNYIMGSDIYWEVGYAPPAEWLQTRGGDVYGHAGITSPLPMSLTNRFFSHNGHKLYPNPGWNDSGLVITGNGAYDFGSGAPQVSAQGWIAQDALPSSDFYQHLYLRLGAPTAANTTSLTGNFDCPGTENICYFTAGAATAGNISIASGSRQMVLVSGNLTINHTIDVADGGFLAFFVTGNITVGPGVGHIPPTAGDGALPLTDDVDGIYVANGNFTIESNGTGDLQFVGNGSFIANSFILNRDFRPANSAYSATHPVTLFVYNPRLLFTMPQIMEDIPVRWEEVAPIQ